MLQIPLPGLPGLSLQLGTQKMVFVGDTSNILLGTVEGLKGVRKGRPSLTVSQLWMPPWGTSCNLGAQVTFRTSSGAASSLLSAQCSVFWS
jgi:hypothetical protein